MGQCPKCGREHDEVDVFLSTVKTCLCGCKLMCQDRIVDASPVVKQENRKVIGDIVLLLLAAGSIWFFFGPSVLASYSTWLAVLYATMSSNR